MGVDDVYMGGLMGEGQRKKVIVFADMKMWVNLLIRHESISILVDFASFLHKDLINIVEGPVFLVQIAVSDVLDHHPVGVRKFSRLTD